MAKIVVSRWIRLLDHMEDVLFLTMMAFVILITHGIVIILERLMSK